MDHITSDGMPTVRSLEEMVHLISLQLLRPMYPGQFPNVRHNLFNIVLVVDLSQTSALQFVAGSLSSIINRGFPFRFGVVPITENMEGECCRSDVLRGHAHYLHLLHQELRWRGFSATLWNIMAEQGL
jgi:hypothetical protein